jgi:hypothetical protein
MAQAMQAMQATEAMQAMHAADTQAPHWLRRRARAAADRGDPGAAGGGVDDGVEGLQVQAQALRRPDYEGGGTGMI